MKRIVGIFSFSLLTLFMLTVRSPHAFASNNNIMDDGVFDNKSSMSAAQIDSWLNANFPNSCISTNSGFSAPDPIGYSPDANFIDGRYKYGAPVSAGTVIFDAAQAHSLNPQVLITKLQNEEQLVDGGGGCSDWRFASAVGYACTDSGTFTHNFTYTGADPYSNSGALVTPLYYRNGNPVNSITGSCVNQNVKAGFSEQVVHAAWLLSFSRHKSEGQTSWAAVGGNWNHCEDNASCASSFNIPGSWACYSGLMTQGNYKRCPSDGTPIFYDGYTTIDGTSVHIDTGATAAFYVYTPHFQSFDTIFQNWFGSIFDIYSWKLTSQYAYTDATKSTVAAMGSLHAGDKIYVGFTAQNTGDATWSNTGANPIMAGTANPLDRISSFGPGSGWLSGSRPVLMKEASVAPGGTGTFEFWMTAPSTTGVYNERFSLIASNLKWLNDTGLSYYAKVNPYTYSWRMLSQYAYTDASKTTAANMNSVLPGQKIYVGFTAQNTGDATWSNTGANPIMAGTANPLDRISSFGPGSGWLSGSRPVLMKEASVAPGGTGTFEFWMTAPSTTGVYNERFSLIANNLTWFNDIGLSYYVNVVPPTYSWQFVGQWAYTDANRTIVANMADMHPGDKVYVRFTAKNTGNVTWSNSGANALMVGTASPLDRISDFGLGSGWLSGSRPAVMKDSTLAPGATGTFEFTMTAPNSLGEYNERFSLIANNLAWLNDPGLSFYAKVSP